MTAPQASIDALVAALVAQSAAAPGVQLTKTVYPPYWFGMGSAAFQRTLLEDRKWLSERLRDFEKWRLATEERLSLLQDCEAKLQPILEAEEQKKTEQRRQEAADRLRARVALRAKYNDPRTSAKDKKEALVKYCRLLMDRPSESFGPRCTVGSRWISPSGSSEFKGRVSVENGWVYSASGKKPLSFVFDWVRDENGLKRVDHTEFEDDE